MVRGSPCLGAALVIPTERLRFNRERQQQTLRVSSGVSTIPSTAFHASFCLTWAIAFQGSLNPSALSLTPLFQPLLP